MAQEEKPMAQAAARQRAKAPQPLVASPVRDTEQPKDPEQFKSFLNSVALRFPSLRMSLSRSQMRYTPAGFVQASLFTAFYMAAALLLVSFLLLRGSNISLLFLVPLAPVFYAISFFYAMQFPSVKSAMRAKRIDQEIVFAGRHMLIELKAGVPLFDAMLGISREYGEVSVEFNKIVEKVTLGVPMGAALHEVAEANPSRYFNRLVLQLANSLASGSDVATALEASLNQISKEQVIELKAYGHKLNPIVMFFMIVGIIMPSLGVAFIIILSSFLGGAGISFGPSALFGLMVAVGLVQFLFLSMIENSRPKFDIM